MSEPHLTTWTWTTTSAGASVARNGRRTPAKARWVSGDSEGGRA